MLDTEKLEYQRARNMLTYKELADKIGISKVSMSKLKTGKTQPLPTTMKALCEVLDCKPEDLLKDV